MTSLDSFKQSNMWAWKYSLPLSPQNNNPWFYLACAIKIINKHDDIDRIDRSDLEHSIDQYHSGCITSNGTLSRWPGSSSQTSHDELIGACYLDSYYAQQILVTLHENSGNYNNSGEKETVPLEFNFYRFPWFIQYVKARAGMNLSLAAQILWIYLLVWDMIKTKSDSNDSSGRLLIWVMSEHMNKFLLCRLVINLWIKRMNRLGITLKRMLTLEPRENPVMAELSPESWE